MENTPSETPCERVLVVDDNADMADSIRDVLETYGVTVATSTSIEAAEAALREGFEPNAMLVDLRLARGEAGEDLIAWMRQHPKFRGVHVIAVSAYPERLTGLRNVDEKLPKPFNVDRLLNVLRDFGRNESAAEPQP